MLNTVILTGRLTKDAEVRNFKEGRDVINFGLAVSENFKDAKGNSPVYFFNCNYWTNKAANIAKYLKKGNLIGITGKLVQRTYDDPKTKKKVSVVEVVVSTLEFLNTKKDSSEDDEEPDMPW